MAPKSDPDPTSRDRLTGRLVDGIGEDLGLLNSVKKKANEDL